jgi:hypothetical protein
MIAFLILILHIVVSPFKTKARLEAEIIMLGHSRRLRDVCRMPDLHPASDISGPDRHFAVGPMLLIAARQLRL